MYELAISKKGKAVHVANDSGSKIPARKGIWQRRDKDTHPNSHRNDLQGKQKAQMEATI